MIFYHLHLSLGKLFQQYIVDAYVRTKQNRLNYHKQHQTALRAEKYKVLVDYMTGDDDTRIGRRIILPATFPGSPRYMVGFYQNSMSIVAKFGKPDEFITFTCNPNWTEITENLFEHQSPSDRPDLISRVFRAKQAEFLDDLIKKGVKGKVKAYMWVIEFQKRGLPHCHLLLCYEDDDKIRTPEQLDQSTGWHRETGNFECSSSSPEKLVDRWEWHPLVYNYLPFSNHGPVGRFTTCICCEVILQEW